MSLLAFPFPFISIITACFNTVNSASFALSSSLLFFPSFLIYFSYLANSNFLAPS
jgi:hypothetical protein